MSWDILTGDVREMLPTLAPKSVQCVVTSPPYFNLRDYSVPGQIGLESTLAEYLAVMVDVFRLVRDVLADDGTVWLNLGDSFYSGGSNASRSRPVENEQPYGTGDIGQRDWHHPVFAYRRLCDGCRAVLSNHSSDSDQRGPESASLRGQTIRDTGHLDCEPTSQDGVPLSAPVSTSPESLQPQPGWCLHCDNCGICLSVLRSTSRDARLCVRNSGSMNGTTPTSQTWADHTEGRGLSGKALAEPPIVQAYYTPNLKPKDLMMVPARLAIALQDDGWYLRSSIIWHKPNPMPESVTDRPTSAHEHIFLLTKSARYYYDADAIAEKSGDARAGTIQSAYVDKIASDIGAMNHNTRIGLMREREYPNTRNCRNVWTIATAPYSGAHFATFPPEIPRRCILAGSRECDTILDPFAGAGTTLLVADRLNRNGIGIELNPAYADMARKRIYNDAPLFQEQPA